MKKTIRTIANTALVITLAVTTKSYSQTSGLWDLQGNFGTNGTNFIGTNDKKIFKIKTFGKDRVTIASNNTKVGIGTTNPAYMLDISNDTALANFGIRSNFSGAYVLLDKKNATDLATVSFRTNNISKWQTGTLGTDDYSIYSYSLSQFAFTVLGSNNNVGIGTVTPTSKLTILNNGAADISIKSNIGSAKIIIDRGSADSTAYIEYRTQGGGSIPTWQFGIISSSNGDFALKNSGATGLSLSASKSTGNIGIGGIPSLSKTLLIYGSTEVFGQLKSGGMEVSGVLKVTGGAGQPGAGKVFTSDANGSGSWEMPGTWNLNGNSSTNGSNFIGTIDNVNFQVKTKNLLRMTVTAGGRVCIGNSLPGFKLDVQGGSINTDSLYRVDGEQVLNRDSLNLKSLTADAKIIIDRGSTGSIAIVEYRTQSGTSAWQTGTTSVDGNFIIKSTGAANQSSIMISKSTGNIGIGGIPSGSRILNVNGAAEINGPLTADGMEVNGILKVNGGAGSPVPGNVLTSDGTGTGTCSWQTPINGGGATNRIAFWKNATSLSSSSNLFWDSTNFRLGIGTGVPAFQLELSTNSAAKPTSSAWTVSSDARLKKDVADFNDGLELIKKIHPIWFNYNGEAGMPTDERGVGTLAQDLQKLAPYMVKEWTYININGEKQNYLGVDYGAMDFILVNAIKEQQQQMDFKDAKISLQQKDIDDLKTKFEAMENALSQCCMSYKSVVGTDGDREESGRVINNSVAKLEQNIPNPFTENSVIKFYIPQNSKNAAIKIYALDGTELKIILVSSKGFGQTQISGKTFAAGTYTYLLVVDGKVVDTKQFILTK